jgi:hypothetical protein
MIPWKVLQGEGQLALFIKHWRTNTIISKVLRITLSWAQWNAGTSKPILQHPEIDIPYLEARWIKSFQQSLAMANFSILVHRTYVVDDESEGDVHLMDWIINSKVYSDKQIVILNCCRLHLHITTISEILDESGRNVLAHVFNCKRPKWFNQRQFMPIQPRPSHHQIRTLWKPMCSKIKQQIAMGNIRMGQWTQIPTVT